MFTVQRHIEQFHIPTRHRVPFGSAVGRFMNEKRAIPMKRDRFAHDDFDFDEMFSTEELP